MNTLILKSKYNQTNPALIKLNINKELYLCDLNKNLQNDKTKYTLRIKQNTDIKENILLKIDKQILEILLLDRTTNENLIWASDTYKKYGEEYFEKSQIKMNLITGRNGNIIKPRVKKNKEEQSIRIRDKAEVFTPSWVCNAQNNLIDNAWLGYKNAFNTETEKGWTVSTKKIKFLKSYKKTWKDYVLANRLEISCGEAPYLTSRYDTVTGNFIEVKNRIGLLDRKLRVITERTKTEDSWIEWAKEATKSIYGYDFQGDNVLLARENILFAVIESFENQFDKQLDKKIILEFAEIISWNIWQMDGLTYSIPYAKGHKDQLSLFLNNEKSEFCLVKDWKNDKVIEFISILKRSV